MKHLNILLLFACLLSTVTPITVLAQIDTAWTRTYGGNSYDEGHAVQQTSDGGFVIVGNTNSFGAGSMDVYLVKTNAQGDTMFTRTYGGPSSEYGYAVQQTKDGGYVIVGETWSYGAGGADVYLIKTNAQGDTVFTKTFGEEKDEYGYDVQQTSDGGYIIIGVTTSTAYPIAIYLVRTKANGQVVFSRELGYHSFSYGYSIRQTNDGCFILTGSTRSRYSDADMYVAKIDSMGTVLWQNTYGSVGVDETGYSVRQTRNGRYLIAGADNNRNVYLVKCSANGLIVGVSGLAGAAGIYESSVTLQETQDGGYLVAGGGGLVKTDTSGTIVFSKSFPYGVNVLYSGLETREGSYVVVGYKQRSYTNTDVYLIKTTRDPLGVSEHEESRIGTISLAQNYPNPMNPTSTISYLLSSASRVRLAIFNVLGQEVRTLVSGIEQPGERTVSFDAAGLPSAIYFYRLDATNVSDASKHFSQTRKMLLIK